jgi:hypothetical protein
LDERPPGLRRAPWRRIEICESSLVSYDRDAIANLLAEGGTQEVVWVVDLIGCVTALPRAVLTAAVRSALYMSRVARENDVWRVRRVGRD